jgi:hypothetical protein
MRALVGAVLMVLCLVSPVRAEEEGGSHYDLGVVLFDSWPRDLPTPEEGVQVRWVAPKSPAAAGGMKPGDIIQSVDLFGVTAAGLKDTWHSKTMGAAGCIDFAILRTGLKSKGWKHMGLCIPVQQFELTDASPSAMGADAPIASITGDVDAPGLYSLQNVTFADALEKAQPQIKPETLICIVAYGPAPLPADDCAAPGDPKWKKLPRNRSYAVTVTSKSLEAAQPVAAAPDPTSKVDEKVQPAAVTEKK